MRIQHNIMAMSAYRNYTNNVSAMKKNLEKLSSGYKINRAGDDAAGLAISEKMRAQITGLETAQKNAKDGISLVQTAEGALTEVHDMLNRMVELASMSANGTYDNTTDRKQLQKEMEQLTDEINRIADSSNFNGIKLLDGSMQQGGQGSTVAGIDRILSETLGAGENPIDQTGLKTILDGGGNSSAQTVFDVDFTGLSGAQAVEGVPSGATPAEITVEKDGHAFTQATKATYSITVADTATLGDNNTGNTQVTIDAGTTTVTDLLTATDNAGNLLSDTYDVTVTKADGTELKGTDTVTDGDIITYTVKTPGALTGANTALDTLSSETVTFTNGEDEKPIAAAAEPATYEFTLNLANLDAGQTISLGGNTVTVKNNATTTNTTDKNIDIKDIDFTSKGAGGALETLANGDLKNALENAFSDYDVEVTYNSAAGAHQGEATIKLTAKTADATGNQGNVAIKSNSDKNPLVGSVEYTKFKPVPADAPDTADFAEVTYQSDDLIATNMQAGTKITIGSGDNAVTIEIVADGTTGTLADNQIKLANAKTPADLQAFIEKQGKFKSGLVTYNATDGTLKFTAAESGEQLEALKAATQVSVAAPVDDTANQVSFAFKLGGVNVADVSVAKDASSADIAKAVYAALSDNDDGTAKKFTIGNSNYDVKLNGNKLTFTLTDAPDATNIKGNYDWDVIADAGTFKGNHTAGTVVTTPGNVGAAGSLANTVFNMTTGDLVDGTKITIDGKTVTLAVGADSQYKDAEGTVIDLTNLDTSKELTAADLNAALGRISEGFGKDGTTNFIVGVNDKANGDKNIGLTIHKKTSSTQTYATKESLAEVFNITTPGTGKALTLQIGDTAEKFNQLKVDIQDMHADSLGIGKDQISIADQDSAAAAITKIKDAINTVSDVRGTLGATQNRLDHTINNLSVMTENIQDAESTIRDVDVAEEMMAYTKNNILIQSAQAMLAQANQVPQGVLQLLQ